MKFMIFFVGGFVLFLNAHAAKMDSITLRGKVPLITAISAEGVQPYQSLDLTTSQVDLLVAHVKEMSNSHHGYTVSVSSENKGYLVHLSSSSWAVKYMAKYGLGSNMNLNSPVVITNQSTPGVYNVTKDFKISYAGAPATSLLEGRYSDTLMFTISAK